MDNHPITQLGLEPSDPDDSLIGALAEHLSETNDNGRQEDHS